MKKNKEGITRRDFMKKTSSMSVLASMGFPVLLPDAEAGDRKTKVVLVRDKNVVDGKRKINRPVIQEMLDRAVMELAGKKNVQNAWKTLTGKDDIVGVKSNEWGPLPTPGALEQAIRTRIMETGVPGKNMGIDDRGVLKNKVFKDATALINVRPLRTHHWAGIGGCVKNYIMFAPLPQQYHGNSCESLGALWDLPMVKGKTKLNILVMLTPLFHGIGPHHFDLTYTWRYNGILVSTDPVAVDLVGLQILNAHRAKYFKEKKRLIPPVTFIHAADTQYHLGTSDMNKIDIVKIGCKENILI